MSIRPQPMPRRPTGVRARQRAFMPMIVLGTSLLLTALATYVLVAGARTRDQAGFDNAVHSTQDRIRMRLETYIALLRGTAALFAASDSVRTEEFAEYVQRLHVRESYPGVQGIGFARMFEAVERAGIEKEMRARIPEFHFWNDAGSSEPSSAILYLEPVDRRNRVAIGYDMWAEPVRRAAMTRALDTGQPTLSGKVRLVQEIDTVVQPGFLIYVPVYRRGAVPEPGAARRTALVGFVYAPFRARDLFDGIFGTESPRVQFQVYDGATDPENLLYDSQNESSAARRRFQERDTLIIADHSWVLDFQPSSAFQSTLNPVFGPLLAFTGLALTMILFLATRAQSAAQARAEQSERTRSRFLAAMSHELRTPLNAVIGYNDLLLAGVYGQLNEAQEKGITRSQLAAKHLQELVNDVLDLSKIEAGKIELTPERVAVHVLIEDLLTTIRPMAAAAGCELRVDCPFAPSVVTDPRRVRQILLNLLSNAAKYGRGQPIDVSCRATQDNGVTIAVGDHGIGIPQDAKTRIFEEFVQLQRTEGSGTGLGLTISSRLARSLGARLEVESEEGVGSTFYLHLPHMMPPSQNTSAIMP